jgi:hypothetical protein
MQGMRCVNGRLCTVYLIVSGDYCTAMLEKKTP